MIQKTKLWLLDQFWLPPLSCAIAAVGLALLLTHLDKSLGTSTNVPFLFQGGPEGARALLSAIITSMISFTGLVFSITIVVLQLTSSQFSPRILRTFLRDRFDQLALGVFVATFVYALVVLRSVQGTSSGQSFVPQAAVTTAFVLVLASVVVFLGYINHIAQSIRASTIISKIGDDTRRLVEVRYPIDSKQIEPAALPSKAATMVVKAPGAGVIRSVDDGALAKLAESGSSCVALCCEVGEFVPTGAPVLSVWADDVEPTVDFLSAVHFGRERSLDEDVAFGLRQLVDIAERALSPGINDPSTAVQSIDQLHDVLRRLATRHTNARQRVADDGRLLVDVPDANFCELLDLATTEISFWGKDSQRIQSRLQDMLIDLSQVALDEHKEPVEQKLRILLARTVAAPTIGQRQQGRTEQLRTNQ